MIAFAPCPDVHSLQSYLHAQLSEDDSALLEEHLAGCDRCAESIHDLSRDDLLAQAIRDYAAAEVGPEKDAVAALIERLRRCPPQLVSAPSAEETIATTAASSATDQAATQELFDFLAPAQAPGELGRLGPYRVLELIGAGGMGVVFRAEDPHLKRGLALKAMKRSLGAGDLARQRFLREAQAVAALEHDHIVPVYQAGEDRGVLYLAMPLLKGEALDVRLKREGRLPTAEALRIAREAAEGLAAAHERGLIHRDVKPANIWLEAGRGRVKLLDFGLARAMDDEAHLTQSGTIAGTPQYMSPEQARGGTVTPRRDLFSAGCVLYQMLTGRPPFRGSDTIATLMAVATEAPAPPAKVAPDVPRAASDLVLRLLAKAPQDRPESAQAVAQAIAELERDLAAPPPRRRRRSGVLLAAAAVPLLLLAAFLIILKTHRGTLVLTVNEPDVSVIVDGGAERLTIKSPRDSVAITLAPGRHSLLVTKDGFETVTREFKIVRGGKEEVSARLEPLELAHAANPAPTVPPPPGVPRADQPQPFVLVHANDQRGETFKHLPAAIALLQEGDAIEVHGNGPFHVPPIRLEGKALNLRAAPGYRPRFVSTKEAQNSAWFVVSRTPVKIEGCDFFGYRTIVFRGEKASWESVNCRFLLWGGNAISYGNGKLRVADCSITNEGPFPGSDIMWLADRVDAELSNNLIRGSGLMAEAEAAEIACKARRDSVKTAEEFAAWLLSQGKLTTYQADALLRGSPRLRLGEYTLLERIGAGRMAGVDRAVHTLGMPVAAKILPPSRAKHPEHLARFQREAKLALPLDHPHVVKTYHAGNADGLHYIIMELLEGETLQERLAAEGSLPPDEVVRLAGQVLSALQHRYGKGIVHRDLKPANLMLVSLPGADRRDYAVKLLDVGLGRALFAEEGEDARQDLTAAGEVLGTPNYVAPEQTRDSRAADIRSDLYSLGCIVYECLTGRVPFPQKNLVEKLIAHANEMPLPPDLAGYPRAGELQTWLARLMAKKPSERFRTPRDALAMLEAWRDEAARPPRAVWSKLWKQVARPLRGLFRAAMMVGAIVAAGAVAAMLLSGGRLVPQPPSPPARAKPAVAEAPLVKKRTPDPARSGRSGPRNPQTTTAPDQPPPE